MNRLQGALVGGALGVSAAVGIHYPLAEIGTVLLSLFLALTACVYLGALLAQRQSAGIVLSEVTVGLGVFLCAAFGAIATPVWLVLGYGAHGAWDWTHDAGFVETRVAPWFPPACAVFDFIIAAFIAAFVV